MTTGDQQQQHERPHIVHSRANVAVRAAGDVHQISVSHINLKDFCFHFDLVEATRGVHLRLDNRSAHSAVGLLWYCGRLAARNLHSACRKHHDSMQSFFLSIN